MVVRSHRVDGSPSRDLARVRPKTLSRATRATSETLHHLNTAIDATQISNGAIARAWGCDEKIVRLVRSGERPLTGERLDLLPRALRVEFARLLYEESAASGPRSVGSLVSHAIEAIGSAASVANLAREAEAVGAEDPRHLGAVEVAATRAIGAFARLASICRERRGPA